MELISQQGIYILPEFIVMICSIAYIYVLGQTFGAGFQIPPPSYIYIIFF